VRAEGVGAGQAAQVGQRVEQEMRLDLGLQQCRAGGVELAGLVLLCPTQSLRSI